MKYDYDGLPLPEDGKKRRPNMPKTVTCHKCGKEAEKIDYGTYACKSCHLCYRFSYGKLIRGSYTYESETIICKNGVKITKGSWACGFFSQNGKHFDYPFNKL